jgi:hypothetical protein
MTHLVHVDPLLFEPATTGFGSDDFVARWEQMLGLKSGELIDGVVYMPSPVSEHARRNLHIELLPGPYADVPVSAKLFPAPHGSSRTRSTARRRGEGVCPSSEATGASAESWFAALLRW